MLRRLTATVLIAGVLTPAISTCTSSSMAFAADEGKPPPPGIGMQLLEAPTATADDPRARTYIIDHLAPGAVITRRVQVSNGTSSPARVSIYPAAASIRGGHFVGAPGHTRNELSTWTSTSQRSARLPPRHTIPTKVTVKVPPNASPGERYGVVWAQVTTPPSSPGGPTHVSRVGIRLYLSIGPGGTPASRFDIVSLTAARAADGAPTVRTSIRNTGGRALDLNGALRLTDGPGGLSAGPFPINLGTTLGIGQTEPVTVALDQQLPNGPWLAAITVRSGLIKRTAHATLTFPTTPGAGAAVPAQSTPMIPWWAIAGVIAALIVVALLVIGAAVRKRRRRPTLRTPTLRTD